MYREKNFRVLAAVVLLICTLGVACSVEQPSVVPMVEVGTELAPEAATAEASTSIPEVAREDTLILGFWQTNEFADYNLFSPFCLGSGYQSGTNYLWEGMAYWNPFTDETIMWQAKSYSYNDDFTELTINLRPEVMWSDGEPFTANDVVYTVNHLRDAGSELRFGGDVQELTEVALAIDDQTVLIRMTQPSPRYFWRFFTFAWVAGFPIMPQHIFEGQDWADFAYYDPEGHPEWPVTTGPLEVVSVTPQQKIMDRRDTWWAVDAGIADGLDMQRVINVAPGTDLTVLTSLVAEASVDITCVDAISARTATELSSQVTTHSGSEAPYGYTDWFPQALYLNSSVDERYADPDVRWAISYLIDRQQLLEVAWENIPPISQVPWPPFAGLNKYTESIAGLLEIWDTNEYNPEKARVLLEGAGYTQNAEGTGMWVDVNGDTLTLPMEANAPQWNATGQVLTEQLQQHGIDASFKQTPESRQKFFVGDYTAHIWGHTGSLKEPYATMDQYSCGAAGDGQVDVYSTNLSTWCDAEFDEVVARMAVTDPEDFDAMSGLTHEAMEIWLSELPTIQLFQWLHNFPMNTTYWTNWPTVDNEKDGEYINEGSQLLTFLIVLDHLEQQQ